MGHLLECGSLLPLFFHSRYLPSRTDEFVRFGINHLRNAIFVNSFILTFMQNAGGRGVSPNFRPSDLSNSLCSASISFVLILLRTLLHVAKTQLPCFQSFPHSSAKTRGVGVPRKTSNGFWSAEEPVLLGPPAGLPSVELYGVI